MANTDTRTSAREMEARLFERFRAEAERLARETNLPGQELPITEKRKDILRSLSVNDTTIVQASTGAGKSLDIGVLVREAIGNQARVAMTQPRRDAAEGVAVATAARHGLRFGEDVCFSTSEFKGNRDKTKLQIQTTGVLLNRFRRDPLLQYYDAVIVDEAHERDMDIDLCLGLLKRANEERKSKGMAPLKIIVASATLPEAKFKEFFGVADEANITAEGKLFHVEEKYALESEKYGADRYSNEKREKPYTELAATKALEILRSTKSGDILIFMPGLRMIRDTQAMLERALADRSGVEVLRLHGIDSMRDRNNVLQGSRRKGMRRVVISTNMAETSVTVPGIRYVIDSCRKNENHFDSETGLTTLQEVPASQAECRQRRGRAGRLESGEYYSLLTKAEFAELPEHPLPEITRSNLSGTILKMLSYGVKEIETFPFVDPPSAELIAEGLHELLILGVIYEDRELTKLGKEIMHLPLEPRMAVVVAAGREYGCLKEVLSIVSMIAGKRNIFRFKPNGEERKKAREAVLAEDRYLKKEDPRFKDAVDNKAKLLMQGKQKEIKGDVTSDWALFLRIFQQFRESNNREVFCEQHGLDFEVAMQSLKDFEKMASTLRDEGVKMSSSNEEEKITMCILRGYAPDHLILQEQGRHGVGYMRLDRGDRDVRINRSSLVYGDKAPLMVCLSLEPGKGEKTVGRGRREEAIFKYAVGLHPVRPEILMQAMPERVRRQERALGYALQDGKMTTTYGYQFKNRKNEWVSVGDDNIFERSEEAAARLAAAIANGQEGADDPMFRAKENQEKIKEYNTLYHRSRGDISQIIIARWYAERMNGAMTIEEAKKVGAEQYIFEEKDFCPLEKRAELDKIAPEKITIQGKEFPVSYYYRPADPNAWSEEGKREKYEATVKMKFETYEEVFSLAEDDFAPLKKQEGLSISYSARAEYREQSGDDLEKIKDQFSANRIEIDWYKWRQETAEAKSLPVEARPLETLPAAEQAGRKPLRYSTDRHGNPVFAFPEITFEHKYNYDTNRYEDMYSCSYFKDEASARQARQAAEENKAIGDRAVKNEKDREKHGKEFKEASQNIKAILSAPDSNREHYWSYEDKNNLARRVEQAEQLFAGDSVYGRKQDAAEGYRLLKEIQEEIAEREKEAMEIRGLLVEAKSLRYEIAPLVLEKMGPSQYYFYGLTEDEYNDLHEKWRETENLLNEKGQWGGIKKPAPEKAMRILHEIKQRLESLRELSEEEKDLFRELNYLLRDGNAKVVAIQAGNPTDYYSPFTPGDVQAAGSAGVEVGRRGEYLSSERGGLVVRESDGQPGMFYSLEDGLYIIGDNGNRVLKVRKSETGTLEPDKIMEGKLYHSIFGGEPPLRAESATYYDETPKAGGFGGSLAEALAAKMKRESTPKTEIPAPVAVPERQAEQEEMTLENRVEFERDLDFAGVILNEALTLSKPKEAKTDKDKAVARLREKVADLKKQLSGIQNDLKQEDARPASMRGKINTLKQAINAMFNKDTKKDEHVIYGRNYDKKWLENLERAWNEKNIGEAIDSHDEAREYIEEELVTREDLISAVSKLVKQKSAELITEARSGKFDLGAIISEALQEF
ncbi:hypothetical protein KKA13_02555 [Patescibacteria group bacterium]|nr:hypothetical protein [Patescibacteria group bacterium]